MSSEMPKKASSLNGPLCTYLIRQNLHDRTNLRSWGNKCPCQVWKWSLKNYGGESVNGVFCPAAPWRVKMTKPHCMHISVVTSAIILFADATSTAIASPLCVLTLLLATSLPLFSSNNYTFLQNMQHILTKLDPYRKDYCIIEWCVTPLCD